MISAPGPVVPKTATEYSQKEYSWSLFLIASPPPSKIAHLKCLQYMFQCIVLIESNILNAYITSCLSKLF